MAILTVTSDTLETEIGEAYDEECSIRISNEAAENGCEQEPRPLTWLSLARNIAHPKEDAVHCVVSVGDPRGGFCFTVRRRPDTGQLIIHTPYPGEGMAHCETSQDHPGTLVVEGDFSDDEPTFDPGDECHICHGGTILAVDSPEEMADYPGAQSYCDGCAAMWDEDGDRFGNDE